MKPNILLITDDQHRWDLYDNRTVAGLNTPNISRLMSDGVTMTHAVSNCPICMPTRMTWMYGLYAGQVSSKLLVNDSDWPAFMPSLPQALRQAGYHTALIGKLHSLGGLRKRDVCAHEDETKDRGFDDVLEVCGKSLSYWYDCQWTRHLERKGLLKKYRDDVARRIEQLGGKTPYAASFLNPEDSMDGFIGANAAEWLKAYDRETPFFLHASFCGPHFPIDPPQKYFDRHRPEMMPAPIGVDDAVDIDRWQKRMAAYCGMIEQIDDEVGRLISVLESKGQLDNTLIVFGTDHGDMMGHKNRDHKGWPEDTSMRTPYIFRLPSVLPSGKVSEAPMEAVDLPATVLSAAGLMEAPGAYLPFTPGRSFWRYLQGHGEAPRQWAYSEMGLPGTRRCWRMVRSARWKFVQHHDGREEFYHLPDDMWEMNNLAAREEYGAQREDCRAALIRAMMRVTAVNRTCYT